MDEPDDGLKILASEASAQRIGRRAFMGRSVVAALSGGVLLAACSNNQSSGASVAGGTSGAGSPTLEDELNFLHWAAYDDPKTPALILERYKSLSDEEKADAVHTLASRPAFALALVARAREIGLGIPGLISWQLIEARRLWRTRLAANAR